MTGRAGKLSRAASTRYCPVAGAAGGAGNQHSFRETDDVTDDGAQGPANGDHAAIGRPSGFRELVGYRVEAWREGYAEIVLDLDARHANRMGIVHGGVYMTILDAAMGHAATWRADPADRPRCVTLGMTTNFLSSAKGGRLRAIARLVGVHDRIAHCRGEILDEDGKRLIAAQASFRYLG